MRNNLLQDAIIGSVLENQFCAGFEFNYLFGWNLNRLTGSRIPSCPCFPVDDDEGAKTRDADFLAFCKRIFDRVGKGFEYAGGFFFV